MKAKTLFVPLLLSACLLASCTNQGDTAPEKPENQVAIYIGNDLYETAPFGEEKVIHVEQKNGHSNEVTLTKEAVYMSNSSCDNQDCVHQGQITLENYQSRPLGEWIICLPNQVTIELVPAQVGEEE